METALQKTLNDKTVSGDNMGKIEAICISSKKGDKKRPVNSARFIADHGLDGDVHAGFDHRQVSLLAAENIESVKADKLPNIAFGDFAENLVVSGLDLSSLGLGSSIRIGSTAQLRISQLGKICHSHCGIYEQTGDCIMPRLGIFANVTVNGIVNTGDSVNIEQIVPRSSFQVVVLTISDRCSAKEAVDTAGPAVASLIMSSLDAHIYRAKILPDKQEVIAQSLRHYSDGHSIDIVLAVGGTGFAPTDVTPEAVAEVIERPTPGLDEVMRYESQKKTPHAMLSRCVSGIRKSTLIISLPGSERAATENLEVILPALQHGIYKLRGDQSDCGRLDSKVKR